MDITALILDLLDRIFAFIKKMLGLVPSIDEDETPSDGDDVTQA